MDNSLQGMVVNSENFLSPALCSYKKGSSEFVSSQNAQRERITCGLGLDIHYELNVPSNEGGLEEERLQPFNPRISSPACPYNYTGKFVDEEVYRLHINDPVTLSEKIEQAEAYDPPLYKVRDPRLVTKTQVIRDFGCKIPIDLANTQSLAEAVLNYYPEKYITFLNMFVSNLFGEGMKHFLALQIDGYRKMLDNPSELNRVSWGAFTSVRGKDSELGYPDTTQQDCTLRMDSQIKTELNKLALNGTGMTSNVNARDIYDLRPCIEQHIETLRMMHDDWCLGYASKETYTLVMMYFANEQGRRLCWDRRLMSRQDTPDYDMIRLHVPGTLYEDGLPSLSTPNEQNPDRLSAIHKNLSASEKECEQIETFAYSVGRWSGSEDMANVFIISATHAPFTWGWGHPFNLMQHIRSSTLGNDAMGNPLPIPSRGATKMPSVQRDGGAMYTFADNAGGMGHSGFATGNTVQHILAPYLAYNVGTDHPYGMFEDEVPGGAGAGLHVMQAAMAMQMEDPEYLVWLDRTHMKPSSMFVKKWRSLWRDKNENAQRRDDSKYTHDRSELVPMGHEERRTSLRATLLEPKVNVPDGEGLMHYRGSADDPTRETKYRSALALPGNSNFRMNNPYVYMTKAGSQNVLGAQNPRIGQYPSAPESRKFSENDDVVCTTDDGVQIFDKNYFCCGQMHDPFLRGPCFELDDNGDFIMEKSRMDLYSVKDIMANSVITKILVGAMSTLLDGAAPNLGHLNDNSAIVALTVKYNSKGLPGSVNSNLAVGGPQFSMVHGQSNDNCDSLKTVVKDALTYFENVNGGNVTNRIVMLKTLLNSLGLEELSIPFRIVAKGLFSPQKRDAMTLNDPSKMIQSLFDASDSTVDYVLLDSGYKSTDKSLKVNMKNVADTTQQLSMKLVSFRKSIQYCMGPDIAYCICRDPLGSVRLWSEFRESWIDSKDAGGWQGTWKLNMESYVMYLEQRTKFLTCFATQYLYCIGYYGWGNAAASAFIQNGSCFTKQLLKQRMRRPESAYTKLVELMCNGPPARGTFFAYDSEFEKTCYELLWKVMSTAVRQSGFMLPNGGFQRHPFIRLGVNNSGAERTAASDTIAIVAHVFDPSVDVESYSIVTENAMMVYRRVDAPRPVLNGVNPTGQFIGGIEYLEFLPRGSLTRKMRPSEDSSWLNVGVRGGAAQPSAAVTPNQSADFFNVYEWCRKKYSNNPIPASIAGTRRPYPVIPENVVCSPIATRGEFGGPLLRSMMILYPVSPFGGNLAENECVGIPTFPNLTLSQVFKYNLVTFSISGDDNSVLKKENLLKFMQWKMNFRYNKFTSNDSNDIKKNISTEILHAARDLPLLAMCGDAAADCTEIGRIRYSVFEDEGHEGTGVVAGHNTRTSNYEMGVGDMIKSIIMGRKKLCALFSEKRDQDVSAEVAQLMLSMMGSSTDPTMMYYSSLRAYSTGYDSTKTYDMSNSLLAAAEEVWSNPGGIDHIHNTQLLATPPAFAPGSGFVANPAPFRTALNAVQAEAYTADGRFDSPLIMGTGTSIAREKSTYFTVATPTNPFSVDVTLFPNTPIRDFTGQHTPGRQTDYLMTLPAPRPETTAVNGSFGRISTSVVDKMWGDEGVMKRLSADVFFKTFDDTKNKKSGIYRGEDKYDTPYGMVPALVPGIPSAIQPVIVNLAPRTQRAAELTGPIPNVAQIRGLGAKAAPNTAPNFVYGNEWRVANPFPQITKENLSFIPLRALDAATVAGMEDRFQGDYNAAAVSHIHNKDFLDERRQRAAGVANPTGAAKPIVCRAQLFAMLDAAAVLWGQRCFFNSADSHRPRFDEYGDSGDMHPWCQVLVESFLASREKFNQEQPDEFWEEIVHNEPEQALSAKKFVGAMTDDSFTKLFPLVPQDHKIRDCIRKVRSLGIMWGMLPTYGTGTGDAVATKQGAWMPLSEAHRVRLLKSVGLFDMKHQVPSNPWLPRNGEGLCTVYSQSYHSVYPVESVQSSHFREWVKDHCRYQPPNKSPDHCNYPFSQYGGTPVEADFLYHRVEAPTANDDYVQKRHSHLVYNRFGFTKPMRLGQQFHDTGYLQDMYNFSYRTHLKLSKSQKAMKNATEIYPSNFMAYARNHAILALSSCNHGTNDISNVRVIRNLYRMFVDSYEVCGSVPSDGDHVPTVMGFIPNYVSSRNDRPIIMFAGSLPCLNAKLERFCFSTANKGERICQLYKQTYLNDAALLFTRLARAERRRTLHRKNFNRARVRRGNGFTEIKFFEELVDVQDAYIEFLQTTLLSMALESDVDMKNLPLHLLEPREVSVPLHEEDTDVVGNDFLGPRTLDIIKDLKLDGDNLSRTQLAILSLMPPNHRILGTLRLNSSTEIVDLEHVRKQIQKGVIEGNKKVWGDHIQKVIRASLGMRYLEQSGPIDFSLDESAFKDPLTESEHVSRYMTTTNKQSQSTLTQNQSSYGMRASNAPGSLVNMNKAEYEQALEAVKRRVQADYDKSKGTKSRLQCLQELRIPEHVKNDLRSFYQKSIMP